MISLIAPKLFSDKLFIECGPQTINIYIYILLILREDARGDVITCISLWQKLLSRKSFIIWGLTTTKDYVDKVPQQRVLRGVGWPGFACPVLVRWHHLPPGVLAPPPILLGKRHRSKQQSRSTPGQEEQEGSGSSLQSGF